VYKAQATPTEGYQRSQKEFTNTLLRGWMWNQALFPPLWIIF